MQQSDFRNESGLDFKDISSEVECTYTFPSGQQVRVEGPQRLNVSASGGHRIYAADGCHYVPAGWVHLRWTVKEGAAHFVA